MGTGRGFAVSNGHMIQCADYVLLVVLETCVVSTENLYGFVNQCYFNKFNFLKTLTAFYCLHATSSINQQTVYKIDQGESKMAA